MVLGAVAAIVVAAAINPSPGTASTPGPAESSTAPAEPVSARPASHNLRGFLSLAGPMGVLVSTTDTVDGTNDPACWGQSQYQDISQGTVVTVYDDRGRTLTHGGLGRGRAGNQDITGQPAASCLFPIEVDDMPADTRSYRVRIAGRPAFTVANTPDVNGVVHAFVALDEDPASIAPDADLPPQIPHAPGSS